MVVRAKRKTPVAKDDISLAEFGEMAYGYLRIPAVLLLAELVYWWATDTTNSFEPYQAGIASLWAAASNLIWSGSAELVMHDSGALTQVNLYHPTFNGGIVPVFVSDECVGMHEIVFLSVLILLTPGVSRRIRWRSVAAMILVVQLLNFIRLMVLHPLAVGGCEANPNAFGCEAPMLEFHQFILSTGFLAVLVLMWLTWYFVLDRKGLVDRSARPSIRDIPDPRNIRFRESLPTGSKALLITALLLTVWATQTVTLDEENQVWKASASTCEWDIDDGWINEDGENCVEAMNRWDEVWGRAYRAWIFSAVFVGFAILTFNTKPEGSTDTVGVGEEE
jgi:exosortase/archaeosortase family protein